MSRAISAHLGLGMFQAANKSWQPTPGSGLSRFLSLFVPARLHFWSKPKQAMLKRLLVLIASPALSGCVPITVNGTHGQSSTCEIHHVAMGTKRVRTGAVTEEQFDA